MNRLFLFSDSLRRDPAIEAWMNERSGDLGDIARRWFEEMRGLGDEIRD